MPATGTAFPSPIVQTKAPQDFIIWELPASASRENVILAENQNIQSGQVLERIGEATGTVAVGPGALAGTGNGTLTLAAPAFGANVQQGNYRLVNIEPAANGGTFQVIRPNGTIADPPTAVVGAAYAGEINFTINDGSVDYDASSRWTIPVTIGNLASTGQYRAMGRAGTPGGLALYPAVTGAGETLAIAILHREAVVNPWQLVWAADITAPEIATGVAGLNARGIQIREKAALVSQSLVP